MTRFRFTYIFASSEQSKSNENMQKTLAKPTEKRAKQLAKLVDQKLAALGKFLSENLTDTGMVSAVFHPHYCNLLTGKNGAQNLIMEILGNAKFAKDSTFAQVKGKAKSADEIIAEFRNRTSTEAIRYSPNSIRQFICRLINSGKVASVQCRNIERSRKVYFLIA